MDAAHPAPAVAVLVLGEVAVRADLDALGAGRHGAVVLQATRWYRPMLNSSKCGRLFIFGPKVTPAGSRGRRTQIVVA